MSPEKKARLIWQCRRGMLELDLLLNRFLTQHWAQLSDAQIRDFEQLLTYPDPEINAWLMGHDIPHEKELVDIVAFIQLQHHVQ